MTAITEELFLKTVAERDAFRDLAEHAIIATAVLQYGPICAGKVVNCRGYYYRIVKNENGALSVSLLQGA